ncbi:MAG: TetR/AcrR family transcriptional regulator [Candidatus Dormibacteria bacterium]
MPSRAYHSALRDKQAARTRQRILDSARRLLRERGYAGTTIEAISAGARVAPQTVYSVFGSKRAVLAGLLTQAAFNPRYRKLLQRLLATSNSQEQLRIAAQMIRRVHESERDEVELLRGAGTVAPELAALERRREQERRQRETPLIDALVGRGHLRAGLTPAHAGDVFWALTGPELYRLLVLQQGWPADAYEAWLADLLVVSLLSPEAAQLPPS